MNKDIRFIDNIPMLLDIRSNPNIKLDVSLEFVNEELDYTTSVEKGKVYRIIYLEKGRLRKIVGLVKNITKIYENDKHIPDHVRFHRHVDYKDYLLTVDASVEYDTNICHVRVGDIRSIKEYIPHMDEENTITDGRTICGITVVHNMIDYELGENDTISGTLPNTAETINGITTGTNSNGNKVTMINMNVKGGTLVSGTIVSKREIDGELFDIVIKNAIVQNGIATGGEIATPIREGSIISYGGTIYGENMVTKGGITTGDTTEDGTTTGGTIIGANIITTSNGQIAYITGNDTRVEGATAFNTTIVGGTSDGNPVGGKVTGGEGTNGVAIGGIVTGGELSFVKDFDIDVEKDNLITEVTEDNMTDTTINDTIDTVNNAGDGTREEYENPFKVGDIVPQQGVVSNFHTADNI